MGAGGPNKQPTSGHTEVQGLTHSFNKHGALPGMPRPTGWLSALAGLQLWMGLGLTEKGPFEKMKEALCHFYLFPLSLKDDKTHVIHF